jgi:hypothetical protein
MLTFFQSVLTLASSLIAWLHDRQLISLATKAASAQQDQEIRDALDRTHDARIGAELSADRHIERLRDDDGFRRD